MLRRQLIRGASCNAPWGLAHQNRASKRALVLPAAARHERVLESAMHAIHGTPTVLLSRLASELELDGKIVAKLEYLSPGFSKKDRIARQMLEDAISCGTLGPGQPVVELTSGNTGTGLAISCACLGHPFIAVMSRGNSMERARMMSALGAEVVLVDQCQGSVTGQVSGDDLARVFDVTESIVAERGVSACVSPDPPCGGAVPTLSCGRTPCRRPSVPTSSSSKRTPAPTTSKQDPSCCVRLQARG